MPAVVSRIQAGRRPGLHYESTEPKHAERVAAQEDANAQVKLSKVGRALVDGHHSLLDWLTDCLWLPVCLGIRLTLSS